MNVEQITALMVGTSSLLEVHGHIVVVELPPNLTTPDRGHRLLSLEMTLRHDLDPEAEVFLRPRGDLNKVRQRLRGVSLNETRIS